MFSNLIDLSVIIDLVYCLTMLFIVDGRLFSGFIVY